MADQRDGGISWTDETWNPVRGCSPSMPCAPRCWAAKMAHRHQGNEHYQGFTQIGRHGVEWSGKVGLIEHELDAPLHWRRPRRVAVGLMGDLFRLPERDIDRIMAVAALCPHHTFQFLTKQSASMLEYYSDIAYRTEQIGIEAEYRSGLDRYRHGSDETTGSADDLFPRWPLPLPNVHLGISCMTQPDIDRDVPILLQTPAEVRWLSLEPMLGPMNVAPYLEGEEENGVDLSRPSGSKVGCCIGWTPPLDWVVVGGESGPGARPMHPEWVRSVRDQCVAAGVPFLFKQWGEWKPRSFDDPPGNKGPMIRLTRRGRDGQDLANAFDGNEVWMQRVGKHAAGRLLDGREWNEMPGDWQ